MRENNIKCSLQCVKDLSIENFDCYYSINNSKEKEINIKYDIKVGKGKNIYEVNFSFDIDIRNKEKKLFLLEMIYLGIFSIKNVKDEEIEKTLFVTCPNLLFPSVRHLLKNYTQDSIGTPILIDPIDFDDLYEKNKHNLKK